MADSSGITSQTFTNRNGRRDRSGRWEANPNDPGESNGQESGGDQTDELVVDREGSTAAYERVSPQAEAVTRELPAELRANPLRTRRGPRR